MTRVQSKNTYISQRIGDNKPKNDFKTIRGFIYDNKTKEGLPGVNIIINSTTIGAASNEKGFFEIKAPSHSTIIFSFLGFKNHELQLTKDAFTKGVKIFLEEDTSLEEVVITAGMVSTHETEAIQNTYFFKSLWERIKRIF